MAEKFVTDVDLMLEGPQIDPYLSRYWTDGFCQERVVVEQVRVEGGQITARCRVQNGYVSPFDERFHLSLANGMACLAHVSALHISLLHGMAKKEHELIASQYTTKAIRMIRKPDVVLKMKIVGRKVVQPEGTRRHPRTFVEWIYDLDDGAWTGDLTVCIPVG